MTTTAQSSPGPMRPGGDGRSPQDFQQDDVRPPDAAGRGVGTPMARALGWFSVGLGIACAAAPHRVATLIGLREEGKGPAVLRAVGLQEIGAGAGLLRRPRPVVFQWGRVAGDLADLALLGLAARSGGTRNGRLLPAAASVAAITMVDAFAADRLTREPDGALRARGVVTVNRQPAEAYALWRDVRNLPRFMPHLESVQATDDRRSRWTATAPLGKTVAWDAEITEDRQGERIAWRSLDGADVDNSGSVQFQAAPGGRGTEVRVELVYNPPGGVAGAAIARSFGKDAEQQVRDALRAFKQVLETGELTRSDATARSGPRPAQPAGAPAQAR